MQKYLMCKCNDWVSVYETECARPWSKFGCLICKNRIQVPFMTSILVHIWTKMYTVHCTDDMIWDIEGNDKYILPHYCYVDTKSRKVLFWCAMVRDLKLIFLNCLSSLSRVWGIYIFCRILVNCISRKVKMSRNNIIWV